MHSTGEWGRTGDRRFPVHDEFLPLRILLELLGGGVNYAPAALSRELQSTATATARSRTVLRAPPNGVRTGAYRRVEAAAIAEERRQQQEDEYRAIAAGHPTPRYGCPQATRSC